jgi:glycosyltransferase involved in cell wall biosynthesis
MHQKKTIVFVLSGYGRYGRGAERFVESLVVRLADEWDIQVLGGGTDAPGAVPLPCLSRESRLTRAIDRFPGLGHACRLFQLDPLNWEWLTSAWAARRWLEKNPCDLLVPEGGRWGGWLGRWVRNHLGIPFVDIAHGAPSRWEISAARYRPDCYVAPTRVAERAMQEAVPGLKIRIIPPGVDTRMFTPEGAHPDLSLRPPVVMAVGALEPLKRMDLILRAVHARGNGSLLLVGDGPQRKELIQMGESLLGPERFLWRTVAHREMPALYRSADLLVSASRSEAFGLVYLEAMACGLPVVTQDDEVRREVLGDAAWYVDAESIAELAGQMGHALADRRVEHRRARAALFDADRTAKAYGDLFRELIVC